LSGGIEKFSEYIERLVQINYDNAGSLNVTTATRMLAILKCLESALTAYLRKVEL
jgi:hypothetical protein